ncbi:MAG TPA: PIG-L family deacetylase [Candidatus Thermoplasmatota archaeon]|nr:PIG-L family deacetylase [Candidatus Thermoplasmatota archaeon]
MRQRYLALGGLLVLGGLVTLPLPPGSPSPGGHLMVFAAHPDDEVLGAAGVIRDAVLRGEEITLVFLTVGDVYPDALHALRAREGAAADRDGDGDVDYRDLGFTRHAEAVAAASLLGVPEARVVFLAFPDGHLWRHWLEKDAVWRTKATNATAVPYPFAYRPGAPHSGRELLAQLTDLLAARKPTRLVTMHPLDSHGDHRATALFVQAAAEAATLDSPTLAYLVHWTTAAPWVPSEYGREIDWISRRPDYAAPPAFQSPGGILGVLPEPLRFALPAGWGVEGKRQALEAHASQMALDGEYLLQFVKPEEALWPNPWESADAAYRETVASAARHDPGGFEGYVP